MTIQVTGRGSIKSAPKVISFEKDGKEKSKVQAVIEFEPFEGARTLQTVMIEGWGSNKKLFENLKEGDWVEITGILNHVSKKDNATNSYKTFTSINVSALTS